MSPVQADTFFFLGIHSDIYIYKIEWHNTKNNMVWFSRWRITIKNNVPNNFSLYRYYMRKTWTRFVSFIYHWIVRRVSGGKCGDWFKTKWYSWISWCVAPCWSPYQVQQHIYTAMVYFIYIWCVMGDCAKFVTIIIAFKLRELVRSLCPHMHTQREHWAHSSDFDDTLCKNM